VRFWTPFTTVAAHDAARDTRAWFLHKPPRVKILDEKGRRWRPTLLLGWLGVVGLVGAMPANARAEPQAVPVAAAVRQPGYRLAFTGSVSLGAAGWGTELAGESSVGVRALVLPWLTAGLSYLGFSAPNNEGSTPFKFQALELHTGWRPVVGSWIDPFVQLGVLGVVNSNGGYMNQETTTPWGLESTAGIDLVRLPLAAGLHAQFGFTNRSWRFIGLHMEVRI
jgi:hypothetical protein